MNASPSHQNFVDWMKAVGMLIIVIGHVLGSPQNIFNEYLQPIYTKQLGVAFFVFVMGWSLMNDKRDRFVVVFNRLFPMYFYGILIALILSLLYFISGHDINESNYMPFMLGINVLFNYFPANPTTWYIGTYLHLLIVWFVFFHNRNVTLLQILLALIIENITRIFLISFDKDFIAYMTVPNWLSIYLIGMYFYKKQDIVNNNFFSRYFAIFAVVVIIWIYVIGTFEFTGSFPFREHLNSNIINTALMSLSISLTYVLYTTLAFFIFRHLPYSKLISTLSKCTILIFILHMPIIYEYSPAIYRFIDNLWLAQLTMIIIAFFGIAAISVVIQKIVNINKLRNIFWKIMTNHIVHINESSGTIRFRIGNKNNE